jgi:hypothetical protein
MADRWEAAASAAAAAAAVTESAATILSIASIPLTTFPNTSDKHSCEFNSSTFSVWTELNAIF